LVGAVRHEIIRVGDAAAAGFTAIRGLHLDDFSAHPGECFRATRPGLELGQIENLDAGEAVRRYGVSIHSFSLLLGSPHPTPPPLTLRGREKEGLIHYVQFSPSCCSARCTAGRAIIRSKWAAQF